MTREMMMPYAVVCYITEKYTISFNRIKPEVIKKAEEIVGDKKLERYWIYPDYAVDTNELYNIGKEIFNS